MLGGRDPVIIFHLAKLAPTVGATLAKIPVIASIPTLIEQPPIPVYLSEDFTGLFIDTESKSVDIETDTETLSNAQTPDVQQKGIATVVEINLKAKKDSTSLLLLSSLIDVVYDKATAKEYAISYLHGVTTVFRGLLHSFVVDQDSNTELISIKISLSKGTKKPTKAAPQAEVKPDPNAVQV